MIYTKKNLREFVNVVNKIIETDSEEADNHGKFVISERDGEIYRGYKWGVFWQDRGSTAMRYIGYGAEYGYPRHAALTLWTSLMRDWKFYYTRFWSSPEFRACVRDIEN